MSEEISYKAKVSQKKQLSGIWIIPLLALGIGLWMLYQHINNTGPQIQLILPTADGLEVGKTQIKALNVNVGVITKITLSENYDFIIAKAQMSKDAERMLKDDSFFWVVKPRIGKEGVSGLETLLSGSYIQLQPGSSHVYRDSFKVLEQPPVAPADAKGLRVILKHREAGKLSVGDPVIYEGFTVGRVENANYNVDKKEASYQLFIFSPYDKLVTTTVHFWLSSGINLKMNAEGIDVKVPSLESILKGGVTFGSVDESATGNIISEQMYEFQLFNDIEQIREGMFNDYVEFVMLFDESVRGLQPNAPVEYRGLRIGTVSQVPLRIGTSSHSISSSKIPVLVKIELGRVYNDSRLFDPVTLKKSMEKEFLLGLRGTLKIGNLLTGSLYIDTDYQSANNTFVFEQFNGYPVFPTVAGGFSQVQKQLSELLDKINQLPVEETVENLNSTLKVLETALSGVTPDSSVYHQLEETLKETKSVMQDLKPIIKKINEKPNSLIFGDGNLERS